MWYHYTKKEKKDKKDKYRPVSILPTLSKCFEKYMFSQMLAYYDKLFSKYQYGFRKGTVLNNVF